MASLVVWFFKSASYDAETHKTFGEMVDKIIQIEESKQFTEEYGYLMFNVGIRGMLIVSLVLMFCYILITAFVDRNYPTIIGIVLGSLSLQFIPTTVGTGGIAILVTMNNGEKVQISELAKANIEGIVLQEVLNKHRQGDQQ